MKKKKNVNVNVSQPIPVDIFMHVCIRGGKLTMVSQNYGGQVDRSNFP